MRSGTILKVNFNEKDNAKALGGKWHPKLKKWFAPEDSDLSVFSKWLPDEYESNLVFALTPLYLVRSTDTCQRCGEKSAVFCLASDGYIAEGCFNEDFFVTFNELEEVPECLIEYFAKNCPSYYIDYSATINASYCMNHCHCGAKRGDFYLHCEPDGGFFPTTQAKAQNITLTKIPFITSYQFELNAGPGQQYPNLIAQYAQRL